MEQKREVKREGWNKTWKKKEETGGGTLSQHGKTNVPPHPFFHLIFISLSFEVERKKWTPSQANTEVKKLESEQV